MSIFRTVSTFRDSGREARMIRKTLTLLLLLACASAALATVHTVNIGGISFSPANLTIQQGDTVRWVKPAGGFHNVAETSGTPVFRSGDPTSNAFTYNFAFNAPLEGLYNYECEVHAGSGMVGTVTVEAGGSAPDAPVNVSPGNNSTDISLDASLSWNAAANADRYTVRFGSTNPPQIAAENITTTNYQPPAALIPASVYFWQITAVNDFGSTPGPTWSFTTIAPPAQASGPFPDNASTNVPIITTLAWEPADRAESYRVYLGTSEPLGLATVTFDTSFDPPGNLKTSTTYLWRVDTQGEAGLTTGVTWSFTTEAGSPAGEVSQPRDLALVSAYPNPFNSSVRIALNVPQDALTRVTIYDLLGREISTLANERLTAGVHELLWNAAGQAGGLYFLKCECAGITQTQKLVYMP